VKRTRLEESTCPVARSLDIIGDWWSLLIVRDALRGVKRFGEFQKSLGIAKNMLTARLKLLVEEGILTLQPASDGSAWQEYVLTDKGAPCKRCWLRCRNGGMNSCLAQTNAACWSMSNNQTAAQTGAWSPTMAANLRLKRSSLNSLLTVPDGRNKNTAKWLHYKTKYQTVNSVSY
jgi:DNA-binding HxlR family transcriptional regulator